MEDQRKNSMIHERNERRNNNGSRIERIGTRKKKEKRKRSRYQMTTLSERMSGRKKELIGGHGAGIGLSRV